MQSLELKQAPDVRRVVESAFPGYRKHKAFLSAFGEHGVSISSYWDGGSRNEYAVVELATGKRKPLPTATHPYFDVARQGMANQDDGVIESDRVGNLRLKILPEGFALVQAGTFCGKPATAHVYLNPANMATLLA